MGDMQIKSDSGVKQNSKEEIQKEKILNRSLVFLSRATQNATGVMAIQKEYSVFFLGREQYAKIYTIKTQGFTENKKLFIEQLTSITKNRIRISIFHKTTSLKLNSYMFMTVYFEAKDFVSVIDEINTFEQLFNEQVSRKVNLNISECSIDNAIVFMHMNTTGEMKQYDLASLINRKENIGKIICSELTDVSGGSYKNNQKYGACYLGKIYPDHEVEVSNILKKQEGNFQFAIDIQCATEEETKLLNFEINKKYNSKFEEERKYINLTYLFSVSNDTQEKETAATEAIEEVYDKNGIFLMPGSGQEKRIYDSICTLGLVNFHSMKNASIELISSLLI